MEIEEKACQKVAKDLGIPVSTAKEIYNSQFQFVKKTMQKGEFETIKLPYFGKFQVKPYRLQKINEKETLEWQ
jgi:nucleoid DNA-binding protein